MSIRFRQVPQIAQPRSGDLSIGQKITSWPGRVAATCTMDG